MRLMPEGSPSCRNRTNSRRYPKRFLSLPRSRNCLLSSVFGGRHGRERTILRSALTLEQARRSDRPIVARRCATPSRLAAGPTIFLTEAREARRHPTSARPIASSTSRSPPRAVSTASPRTHSFHPAVLSPPVVQRRFRDTVLARQIRRPRPGLVLLQHPDDLIFREPCSLHLSVLQEGRTLNPRGGKSQWQVNTLVFLRTRRAFPSARQATGEGQRSRGCLSPSLVSRVQKRF